MVDWLDKRELEPAFCTTRVYISISSWRRKDLLLKQWYRFLRYRNDKETWIQILLRRMTNKRNKKNKTLDSCTPRVLPSGARRDGRNHRNYTWYRIASIICAILGSSGVRGILASTMTNISPVLLSILRPFPEILNLVQGFVPALTFSVSTFP
jgi:hypothetical protein